MTGAPALDPDPRATDGRERPKKYELHHVKVRSPQGRGVLSSIEVDGQEMRGVTVVDWHVGVNDMTVVRIELVADMEFEGEALIVKEWRRLRPSPLERFRRVLYGWVGRRG